MMNERDERRLRLLDEFELELDDLGREEMEKEEEGVMAAEERVLADESMDSGMGMEEEVEEPAALDILIAEGPVEDEDEEDYQKKSRRNLRDSIKARHLS